MLRATGFAAFLVLLLAAGLAVPGASALACQADADCDDGNVCTDDVCSEGACVNALPTDCADASRGFVTILPGQGPTVAFRWRSNRRVLAGDFGDPTSTSGFALCMADALGTVTTLVDVPAGGTCGTRPCWTITRTGVRHQRTEEGVTTRLSLTPGLAGDARIALRAKSPALAMPALPPVQPMTVLLRRTDGAGCWAARFVGPGHSGPVGFTDRQH